MNKPELLKSLKANIELFKNEYGDDFSPEAYISTLQDQLLDVSQEDLAVLPGFGRKNGWAFQRRFDLSSYYINNKQSFSNDSYRLSQESKEWIKRDEEWDV